MKTFITDDFLLNSEPARRLYHEYAEGMPIFDYHCHLNPQEIYEDKQFSDIGEAWLAGDHYKWRVMRTCGVPEEYVTGKASFQEKFQRFAAVMPALVGNPIYHWSHLELLRFFGVEELLDTASAPAIWDKANSVLQSPQGTARALISSSKVRALCTTDDPADTLEHHAALAADGSFPVKVLPAFRPETALHPEQVSFRDWVARLGEVTGRKIAALGDLEEALAQRAAYFQERGCLIADQSLQSPDFTTGTRQEAEAAFRKALAGEDLSPAEQNAYQTQLLLSLGRLYKKMGFVMQLHFGVLRNTNSRMFPRTGPDAGFDCVGDGVSAASMAALFDALDKTDELPPTVIYSLNACDDDKLASVLGAFQQGTFPQKMQLGAPWWFSDHKDGMVKMMKALANTGLLSGFIGMLTDSRSFLSYARHEYFRRVLCGLLGQWMEDGEIPDDEALVGAMVKDICYGNAAAYFGLEK